MNNFYRKRAFWEGVNRSLMIKLLVVALWVVVARDSFAQITPGTYYIRKPGTNLFLTRGSGTGLTFLTPQADKSLQRFIVSLEANSRYKIVAENPGTYLGYLNEFASMTTSAYVEDQHTYYIYANGSGLYAIQNAGAGKNTTSNLASYWSPVNSLSYWAINGVNLAGRQGAGQTSATVPSTPFNYAFEFIPYTTSSKTDQTITFSDIARKNPGDADFDPGATASSGLPVVYTSSNTNVATIVDGKVHLVGSGYAYITATQAGDETYRSAEAVKTLRVNFAASSLTTYYKFDDNLNDNTGNFLPVAVGAPTYVAGKNGKAINLNGTSDYLKLPDGIVATHDNISIAVWVKLGNLNGRIVDFGDNKGNYWFLSTAAGRVRLEAAYNRAGSTSPQGLQTSNVVLTTGTWKHIVLTFSAGTSKIYVDGLEQTLTSNTAVTFKPSDYGVAINNMVGYSQFAQDALTNAALDELQIYNYALTSTEVAALSATVLPVSLIQFSAKPSANGVDLSWETSSEEHNAFFSVEKSYDGKSFMKLAHIPAKPNAGVYTYQDASVAAGKVYYRLLQTDKDGATQELALREVSVSLGKDQFLVYPNPVMDGVVKISLPEFFLNKTVLVELLQLDGTKMATRQIDIQSTTAEIVLDKKPAPGIYLIRVNGAVQKVLFK